MRDNQVNQQFNWLIIPSKMKSLPPHSGPVQKLKINIHKIAEAMACMAKQVIDQALELKEELVENLRNESRYIAYQRKGKKIEVFSQFWANLAT